MELKLKYHYTYFIKPFFIQEDKYNRYILNLLKNKNCKLKIFEKERDLNLYSYFIQNTREYFFPTFNFTKEKINELNRMDNVTKTAILSKLNCNIFEYDLKKNLQGKINSDNSIFFNIDKLEIVCLNTGICFLIIKTNIENTEKFSDLLNFNYQFKDINSEFSKLKTYNNIKIQTDAFSNMVEFSNFINEITGVNENSKLQKLDLYNKRFFVYTYACIEQDNWNCEEDFAKIENDFIKYTNVLSNDNTSQFKENEIIEIENEYKYAKFGFTKQSATLMASGVDINNYTKIPFEYENEYLYTLIIGLYQRIYLKTIEMKLKKGKKLENIRNDFSKFTREIWSNDITNSSIGTKFLNKWREVFELDKIYKLIKSKYDVIYKNTEMEKNSKLNKFVFVSLIISLLFNIVNFIILAKCM